MKFKTVAGTTITALIVLTSAQAFAGKSIKYSDSAPLVEGTMVVQLVGTVKAVDANARRLSVESAQGAMSEWQLDPRVRDLAAIPLGSQVTNLGLQPVSLTPVRNRAVQEMIPGDDQVVLRVERADAATGVVMMSDANGLPIEVRMRDPRAAAAFEQGALVKVTSVGRASIMSSER